MLYIKLEKRKQLRAAAMPEVKRLVKKYGRTTIQNCLLKLKEHDKTVARIAQMKRELQRLEKSV
ncbi:MAG: hypothetical protein KGL39_38310 [Patescibacteria group bacterium]|nr:hypothetical protein [Patescibacteria group bacterium]